MNDNFPVVRPSQGIRTVVLAMRTAATQGTATAAVFSRIADRSLDILADRVAEAEELQARTHARLQRIEAAARDYLDNTPVSEIELAREAFGNTNTRIILDSRGRL